MSNDETVTLESWNPEWPELYELEGLRILERLDDVVVDIAHIGSTAIDGMRAKPIVDIMVGVSILNDILPHVVTLQQMGYQYLGEAGVPGRLYFRKRGDAAFNLSVVEHDGGHWYRNLLFRDYLRAHPDEAQAYADLKRSIAAAGVAAGADMLKAYSDAKSEHISTVLDKAAGWQR